MVKKSKPDFIAWLNHPDNDLLIPVTLALAGGVGIAGLIFILIYWGLI